MSKIQDVTKQQKGILQTFLDYGSLAIIVNVQEAPFIVNFVPKPDRYFRRISLAKHTYTLSRTPEKRAPAQQEQNSFTTVSL